jgi:DNA-binding CsgD family transcriptional regulator
MTIKDKLEGLDIESSRVKETVVGLVSGINQQLKQNAFEDFEKYFIEVHPRFYNSLKQKYPDLSQNELKVCALIRLNLNNKQIAEITGKSSRSVENTRYFIRKKMDLSLEDNLFEEISKL